MTWSKSLTHVNNLELIISDVIFVTIADVLKSLQRLTLRTFQKQVGTSRTASIARSSQDYIMS